MLGLTKNPAIGDALTALGLGLSAYGSGNPNWGQNAILGLQNMRQNRMDNQRQTQQMQQQQQLFEFQKRKYEDDMKAQADEAARRAQQQQAFSGLLPTLPEAIRPTAEAMGPGFLDLWGKEQVQQLFPDDDAPKVAGGMFWDGDSFEPIPGYLEQQSAIRAAGRAPGGGSEYGLNPFFTVDANGNVIVNQLSKSGGMVPVQLPEGQSVAPQPQMLNTGTGYVPVNKLTGGTAGDMVPIDVAGKVSAEETAKNLAAAKAELPKVEGNALTALDTIDKIRKHPSLEIVTGLSGKIDPRAYLPEAQGLKALIDQAAGGAFLTAFESIKGGGHITEVEGIKATQAIFRMQTAQDKGQFEAALDDYEDIIKRGVERARKAASGGQSTPSAPDTDLSTMSDDDLLKALQ